MGTLNVEMLSPGLNIPTRNRLLWTEVPKPKKTSENLRKLRSRVGTGKGLHIFYNDSLSKEIEETIFTVSSISRLITEKYEKYV